MILRPPYRGPYGIAELATQALTIGRLRPGSRGGDVETPRRHEAKAGRPG